MKTDIMLFVEYTPHIEYVPGRTTQMTITYKVPHHLRTFVFVIRELFYKQNELRKGGKTISIMQDMQLHNVEFIQHLSIEPSAQPYNEPNFSVTIDVHFCIPTSVITPIVAS